jgi:hypothetical protein
MMADRTRQRIYALIAGAMDLYGITLEDWPEVHIGAQEAKNAELYMDGAKGYYQGGHFEAIVIYPERCVDQYELLDVVLHETAHYLAGPDHDDEFRDRLREMRRHFLITDMFGGKDDKA